MWNYIQDFLNILESSIVIYTMHEMATLFILQLPLDVMEHAQEMQDKHVLS